VRSLQWAFGDTCHTTIYLFSVAILNNYLNPISGGRDPDQDSLKSSFAQNGSKVCLLQSGRYLCSLIEQASNKQRMEGFLINNDLLKELMKLGSVNTFEPEAVLMNEGSSVRAIPIVLSGSIKVLRSDEDGKEILLYYINPGESCIMSCFGNSCAGSQSKIKAIVDDRAEVLMLPIQKAREMISTNPAWSDFVLQLYNRRFEELLGTVNAIAFQKMDERLWNLLKAKVRRTGSPSLPGTHQQLADELGTAREVVSRLLKQLEKDGKITLTRNKIFVLP